MISRNVGVALYPGLTPEKAWQTFLYMLSQQQLHSLPVALKFM